MCDIDIWFFILQQESSVYFIILWKLILMGWSQQQVNTERRQHLKWNKNNLENGNSKGVSVGTYVTLLKIHHNLIFMLSSFGKSFAHFLCMKRNVRNAQAFVQSYIVLVDLWGCFLSVRMENRVEENVISNSNIGNYRNCSGNRYC